MAIRHRVLTTVLLTLVWVVASALSPQRGASATPLEASSTPETLAYYPVVHVVDGDTIDVQESSRKVRVRLIGIDTPEVVDPRKPVQCYGAEASAEMKRIANGPVRLQTDPTQDRFDKYGRLLAYVFLQDGTDVNLHMIEGGFAREYTYEKPYEYRAQFTAAQARAQAQGLGLWSACGNR